MKNFYFERGTAQLDKNGNILKTWPKSRTEGLGKNEAKDLFYRALNEESAYRYEIKAAKYVYSRAEKVFPAYADKTVGYIEMGSC